MNYQPSDDDFGNSDGHWSDAESLDEFEGAELESNFLGLRDELRELGATVQSSTFEQVSIHRSSQQWMTAESSRSLGYNGHSSCTKRRQRGTGERGIQKEGKFSVSFHCIIIWVKLTNSGELILTSH